MALNLNNQGITSSLMEQEELREIIQRISELSRQERTIVEDLPEHFRRMVLHFGSLKKLLALLRKSIKSWQWQEKEKMQQLLQRLLRELDPQRGIITNYVYAYTSFAPLQRLEKQKLEEEEKVTFQFYEDLNALLKTPHHPRAAAKLKKVQERLARAARQEKLVLSLSVHLSSLLETYQENIESWKKRIEEEQALLEQLQREVRQPFTATNVPLLRGYLNKLEEHLRYGRQLQIRLHEGFYKPFRKFVEEKYSVERNLQKTLEARRRWYPLYRKPQITRQDFMLDYYTLTSASEVLHYIAALEELGEEVIAPDLRQFLRRNKRRLVERMQMKEAAIAQERQAWGKDPLTGVLTRGLIEQRLTELLEHGKRTKAPFSLLLLDIDFFKSINDHYGHLTGDAVLQKVAKSLQEVLRRYDLLGRFGGEEFLVLLPQTGKEQALAVAEKLRENVIRRNFRPSNPVTKGPITISVGIAVFSPGASEASSVRGLLEAADKALYRAKQRGRNRAEAA